MVNNLGAFLLIIVSINAHALDVPPLKAHVNDYAGMLSANTVSNLESQLAALESTDSTQVVVLTIESLEGEVLEEFSMKVAEKWEIGQKKLDNGVILLISKSDKKIRIEVGRGLEGKLTDLISGRIIRDEITPKFKRGDYDKGVAAGVSAIAATVKGEYKVSSEEDFDKAFIEGFFWLLVFTAIFVRILWLVYFRKLPKSGALYCGLIGGTVFTAIHSTCYRFPGAPLLVDIPVAFLFGFGASVTGMGKDTTSGNGGSSFSSGSSFSGGGGSFGGGGASGGW